MSSCTEADYEKVMALDAQGLTNAEIMAAPRWAARGSSRAPGQPPEEPPPCERQNGVRPLDR